MTNVSFQILSWDQILIGEAEGGRMLVKVPKREKSGGGGGGTHLFPVLHMEYSRNREQCLED